VHVLTGSVLNKMNDDPMTIKDTGDSFYEAPGCRHIISANVSTTESASILVTLILETQKMDEILEREGPMGLVAVDEEFREAVLERMMRLEREA